MAVALVQRGETTASVMLQSGSANTVTRTSALECAETEIKRGGTLGVEPQEL
jgi:hypothetical protein